MNITFDLDGTIIDSSTGINAALTEAVRQAGLMPCNGYSRFIGPKIRQIIDNAHPGLPDATAGAIAAEFKERYRRHHCLKYEFYPEMKETIHNLFRGHRISVATNKGWEATNHILCDAGIMGHMQGVMTPDCGDYGLDKAQMLKILDSDLMVGDSNEDGIAAQAAGVPFLFVKWGFGTLDEMTPRIGFITHPNMLTLLDNWKPGDTI